RMSKHYAQHEAESRLATPVNGSVPALQGLRRRGSVDDKLASGRMLMINIEEAMAAVLAQEDTNGDYRITIEDTGPKAVNLPTMNSDGYRHVEIRGWYPMMVLMRELELARSEGKSVCYINEAELFPNPVDLLGGMISESFWDGLVRCMDAKGIKTICADPKNSSPDAHPIIYVPHDDEPAFTYYTRIARELADLNIEVVKLPVDITPEYVNSINNKAGILALAADVSTDASGNQTYKPLEFVVPGGRFNEQYGWDSYFEALGLLVDGRIQLAKNMVDNFAYEIKHYGKILNANRSYYLTRSQPPFLTDMIIRVYDAMTSSDEYDDEESFAWLRRSFEAAITEYFDVWMAKPRYNEETGLSCYYTTGTRMPPETEPGHFHQIIKPYADKLGISVDEYTAMYGREEISEPELDEFFVHDRAVRESGHDTSYRLERRCAHLATIDLNSLLYKYEIDIADSLDAFFGGRFVHSATGRETTSDEWRERAQVRNRSIDRYLWNEEKGLYYDYDVKLREQSVYESVTSLWPLWAGCATDRQAERLVRAACDKFEEAGGLVSGTEESRGVITLERPNRQWDFPYGWAPHQIMAWYGLYRYGFGEVAQRHAYRWLYTIILAFYNHSGTVVEKLD
ncbi:alpha,alpha-trehalase nth1, partial [Coemansia nantahalensis]